MDDQTARLAWDPSWIDPWWMSWSSSVPDLNRIENSERLDLMARRRAAFEATLAAGSDRSSFAVRRALTVGWPLLLLTVAVWIGASAAAGPSPSILAPLGRDARRVESTVTGAPL